MKQRQQLQRLQKNKSLHTWTKSGLSGDTWLSVAMG